MRIGFVQSAQLSLSMKPFRKFEIFKTAWYKTAGELKYVISSTLSTGAFANAIQCQTHREIFLKSGFGQVFWSSEK